MAVRVMEDLSHAAERVRLSTVEVDGGRGGGSGVIWSPDGRVVTNAHVARRGSGRIRLSDGRSVRAAVTARDPQLDLALLQADARDLPAADIGDSNALRVGELVLAVGSPYGQAGAVTLGIVHAGNSRAWVEADLRLAPGNSGGPLANAEGRVVGINTMVARGLALAIPSNVVEAFVRRGGRPARRLGVTVEPVNTPELGLLIVEVEPGSVADVSGLQVGDVLTGCEGRPFQAPFDLAHVLAAGGSELRLDLLRGGRPASCRAEFEPSTVGAAAD